VAGGASELWMHFFAEGLKIWRSAKITTFSKNQKYIFAESQIRRLSAKTVLS
jgi:hypothetical protein